MKNKYIFKKIGFLSKHFMRRIVVFESILMIILCLPVNLAANNEDIQVTRMNSTEPTQSAKEISGVISDKDNEPIVGANVVIKGTTRGIITDIDGKFTIQAQPDEILTISYIGYIKQEIPIGGQTVFNITLLEDLHNLEEIVVVGYGTMRKKDLTGAVSSLKKTVVENEKPQQLADILRGNIPGIAVGFNVSAKGGGDMQIRGKNTLKAGSSPLIVMDGIIYEGDISNINPNDIETIDILKDASSAAIYGARSANGVVLISTKMGTTTGKPVINFDVSFGVATIAQMAKVRDHEQFMTWRQDVMKSMNYYNQSQKDKLYIYDNPFNLPAGVTLDMWRDGNQNDPLEVYLGRMGLGALEIANYKAGKYIDWADYCFQNGTMQNYNVSIAGSLNNVKYYWSLGYDDNTGNRIGDRFNTVRSLLKLDVNITDWLNVGLQTNFSTRNEGYVPINLNEYRTNSPYGSRYEDDGVTIRYSSTDDPASIVPDYDRTFIDRRNVIRTWTNNIYAKIRLPLDISYEFNFAPRFEYTEYMNHQSALHQEWGKSGGLAERNNSSLYGWEMNNILKWNRTFADNHRFEVTLLANAEQRQYWYDRMTTQGFSPSDVLGYHQMGAGRGSSNVISSNDEYSTADALMARLFYSLKGRYMLTLSVRRDGYSAFGLNHPYGTFPSIAPAWVFSEEDFLKNDFLTYGKIRFSYGENGNRAIGIYDALSNMSSGKYPYQPLNGSVYEASRLFVNRMANSDLKWEKKRSFNIGLDFGVKNELFSGSIDLYNASTLDLLVDRKMTNVSGFTSTVANMGQVDNTGIEVSLNSKIMERKNFRWDGTVTFTTNKNKIVHLYGNMEPILDANGKVIGEKEADDINNGWFIGHPIDEVWNYKVLGVWQLGEEEEAYRYNQFPGDFKLLDKNNDGRYNDDDKEFLGRSVPKFYWSMRHSFNIFKSLDISFMLYSQWGHITEYNSAKNTDGFVERHNSFLTPYWTPENPINNYSRIRSQTGGIAFNVYRERSFVRMDNISLGYQLPKSLIKHVGITGGVKITGSIRNVFCWAPHWPDNYWDPEAITRNNPSDANSQMLSTTPRNFVIGISVTL